MTNFKKFLAVLSILCYVTAGAVWQFPAIIDVPASWIGYTAAPRPVAIVVIEETGESTQAIAKLRSSPAIRDWAKSGGHKLFFIDQNSKDEKGKTPANFAPYIKLIAGKQLPQIFILNRSNKKILEQADCPLAENNFLSKIKKWGGK